MVNSDAFRRQGPEEQQKGDASTGNNRWPRSRSPEGRPQWPISSPKKHLSRRTFLRGSGVALGLPFLEAMVPAGTALAQTAAAPKTRAGFFYLPHGAIMNNTAYGKEVDTWTSTGKGADFKLGATVSPLEPFKKYVTTFENIENSTAAGSVHTLNPATWLSCVRPDTAAKGASLATTLDQIIAQKLGQQTALPSMELASETTVQIAAGNGGFYSDHRPTRHPTSRCRWNSTRARCSSS